MNKAHNCNTLNKLLSKKYRANGNKKYAKTCKNSTNVQRTPQQYAAAAAAAAVAAQQKHKKWHKKQTITEKSIFNK